MAQQIPLKFVYKNYKKQFSVRNVIPIRVYWGSTEFHTEEQWLMECFDIDKEANMTFAINDMTHFLKD